MNLRRLPPIAIRYRGKIYPYCYPSLIGTGRGEFALGYFSSECRFFVLSTGLRASDIKDAASYWEGEIKSSPEKFNHQTLFEYEQGLVEKIKIAK